ncbi:MAG: hypothetical protein CM1200mP30_04180 [Pseudomonadota bacterium]|nr:MAG: hypothetical protein CM1200mP30_04180 [Pseudomonadota bacterium]
MQQNKYPSQFLKLEICLNLIGVREYKNDFGSKLLVMHHENQLVAVHEQGRAFFRRGDPLFFEKQTEKGEFSLSAPMPGNVIRVLVKSGRG